MKEYSTGMYGLYTHPSMYVFVLTNNDLNTVVNVGGSQMFDTPSQNRLTLWGGGIGCEILFYEWDDDYPEENWKILVGEKHIYVPLDQHPRLFVDEFNEKMAGYGYIVPVRQWWVDALVAFDERKYVYSPPNLQHAIPPSWRDEDDEREWSVYEAFGIDVAKYTYKKRWAKEDVPIPHPVVYNDHFRPILIQMIGASV